MGVKRDLDSANMSSEASNLTEDEAALYDRQIRLWGLKCQESLRESRVLIIGLNGLAAEVVKNLTLSGVKSITIVDNKLTKTSDLSAQFFCATSELGKNRAEVSKAAIQELNPNVQVIIDTDDPESKSDDFFSTFTVICVCDVSPSVIFKVNQKCRNAKIPFFCGSSFGYYGYCFLDAPEFAPKKEFVGPEKNKIVKRNNYQEYTFCSLEDALKLKVGNGLKKRVNAVLVFIHIIHEFHQECNRYPAPESHNEDLEKLKELRNNVSGMLGCDKKIVNDEMLRSSFGEISPICAIVGGIYANEIIKRISEKDNLLDNFFFFNGDDCLGSVEALIPVKKL